MLAADARLWLLLVGALVVMGVLAWIMYAVVRRAWWPPGSLDLPDDAPRREPGEK
ncbi:hypothetical protein [Mariniluteicoccus endophyticus]